MTSADQPYVPAIPGPKASDDPSFMRDTNAPEENAQDDLANFAALADPDTIAGAPIQNKVERENSDLVGRLRAELQRRAKQVESLSHDLSSTQTAKTDTEERVQLLDRGCVRGRRSGPAFGAALSFHLRGLHRVRSPCGPIHQSGDRTQLRPRRRSRPALH
jgi:hypothetical protein